MFRTRHLRRPMLATAAIATCLAAGPALAERRETSERLQRFGDSHPGPVGADKKLVSNDFIRQASSAEPALTSTPAPPAPSPTNDGFKPAGKFDVRLDKVVAEGRYWHVYLTLRNATSGALVQAQGVDVRLEDSEGIGVESGQAVRARSGPPELFGSPPPTTRPGGTLPVKFVFDRREGAAPARIVVTEGEHEAAFRLG